MGQHIKLRGNRPILLWLIAALLLAALTSLTALFVVVLPQQAVQQQATATAQALSTRFARATGLINLQRWPEAEVELLALFDIDPTYPEVQTLLATVSAETARLAPSATPTPTAATTATFIPTPTVTTAPTLTPMPTSTTAPSPTPTHTQLPTFTPTSNPTATPTPASTATAVVAAAAPNKQPAWTPVPLPASVPLRWIQILEGSFVMGSTEADIWSTVDLCNEWEGNCRSDWFDNELPQRTLWLPTYSISRHEITNQQYSDCVNAGYCPIAAGVSSDGSLTWNPAYGGANYPVVGISYYDASRFCSWVGGSLPTEEQWEKAARGTDARIYPWGNAPRADRANLNTGSLQPVGAYASGVSPYDLHDMAGNAFEWTSSSVDGKYVLRGGSWHTYPFRGRTADRGTKLAPTFTNFDIGFRCVR